MKKSDLKTGMRAELRNGDETFVSIDKELDEVCFTEPDGVHTTEYSDELSSTYNERHDVVKIFDIPNRANEFFNINKKGRLLWERKEEKTIVKLDGVEYSESTLRSLIKKATNS